ncbi:MAG: FG-GAP-like repeat-containing protein, partial [Proteobacteria bacterium]|nr:FG-GAP-like repeat-containing protein [Pseudomonadota bacterium]
GDHTIGARDKSGTLSQYYTGTLDEVRVYDLTLTATQVQTLYNLATPQANTAPQVNAGSDQAVTLPASAVLTATVTDDGQPDPPGSAVLSWSKSTGPGSVTFSNPDSTSTTASFSVAGTYVLTLSADDGELQASDTVTVTVAEQLPTPPGTPTGLTGPASDNDGSYSVSWNAVATASTYELQRQVDGGAWITIQNTASTARAESGLTNGTHSYRVRACNPGGCSNYTATLNVAVAIPPATPGSITGPGTDYDGAFTLNWGSVAGATYYELERQADGSGSWFLADTTLSPTYDETGLSSGTYHYRARACNSSNDCSGYTNNHTVLVTVTVPPPPPPPVPGPTGDPGASRESDETGTTRGSFRVDESGSATYSIPIVTAAGTAGVAPDISLNYSSGSGNGVVGMGWSIGGMSAITRCKQTYDQDRNPQPITWSSADRYCLDGQRLLLENVAQTYGAADTTYRTEVDNGAIVTIRGVSSGEPDYFEVKRKDGSTTFYGKSPDDTGNVSAKSGGGAGKTFIWGIRHFEDNIGNPIWFDYDNDANGQRIKTIYWAFGSGRGPVTGHGARLEFVYTDRDDDRVGYVAGVELATRKRLSQIKSYNVIGAATLIRQYNLEYNEGITAADDISRLTSVEECAGGACLPETTFDWRVPTASASLSQLSTRTLAESSDLSDLTLADVNGDGLMDLVWLEGAASNAIMNYAISNGTSLMQVPFSNGSPEFVLPGGGEDLTPIDYNLDGRYDIAYWSEAYSHWRVVISEPQTDGTWRLKNSFIQTPITEKDVTFVDIDSNGTTDAVWAVGSGNGIKQLKRSLLAKNPAQPVSSSVYYYFSPPVNIGSPSSWTIGSLHAVAPDFNGDGRVGLMMGRDTKDCEYYEFNPPLCFGNGYASALNIVDPTSATPTYAQYAHLNTLPSTSSNEYARVSALVVTDINADGLSDLFYPVWLDPDADQHEYRLAINDGAGGFDVRQHYLPTLESSGVQRAQFVDWNGDNHPDLVWKETTGSGSVRIRYWDAATNALGPLDTITFAVSNSTDESVYFPDINGDGVPDMIKIDTSTGQGNVTIYTRKIGTEIANRAANRIEKITNGIGAETRVTYEPLSYSDHYERMVIDATPQAPGGGLEHCIWKTGEPICVNPPVTAADSAEFYTKINGDWEVPAGAVALQKTSPVIEAAGPMYVVTDVDGSAPAATLATPGSVSTTAISALEYHYYEAKVQAAGRGFLGFLQLKTVDTIANVETTTQYRQDWPFTGLPIGTVVSSSSDRVIGGGSTDWDILEWTSSMPATAAASGTAALGAIHVEQTSETSNVYDLVNNGATAGALLSTTTTDTTYDAEANAETISVITTNQVTQQDELIVTTTNVFDTSTFSLWQGRLKSTTVVTNRPSVAGSTTRHSTFQYYTSGAYLGMLERETIEPGHADFELTKTHFYDAHGNRKKTTVSDGTTTRCSAPAATSVYDGSGRYVDRTYDCLGRLTTEVVTRNGFGLPTRIDSILDETVTTSRLTTIVYYGAMGREYHRTSDDGSFKTTYFSPTAANCPTGSSYKMTEYTAGGGTAAVCYDVLTRETRKLTLGFDGQWDAQDTNYDSKGRVLHKSEPYELLSGAAYWTSIEYDLVDRATRTTLPDSSWSQTAYAGFDTTTTISYQGQTRTEKRNALGDIVQAVDNLGGTVDFTYDNLGNLATTTDSAGNVTTTIHNALGQKTQMRVPHSDPGKGVWTYEYNHFGEMVKQTNANGHTSEMTFDGLGRMKTRVDRFAGGTTDTDSTWTYDTSPNGLGKLDTVLDTQSGFARAVLYDSLGRVDEVVTNFDAGAYFEKTTYDQHGRVYQVFDAAGDGAFTDHGTQNQYGYYGHLVGVADAVEVAGVPRTVYRQITGMNARGQVTSEKLGVDPAGNAAVTTEFFYYEDTGRMKDIEAKDGTGAFVQDLYYEWNTAGSLTKRQDTYHGVGGPNTLTELFGYDGLNRLTSHGESGQTPLAVTYDAIGNIKTKTGIQGTYQYGVNAGPHAVTSANGQTYVYDDNGNNVSGGGRTINYSTFDKPTKITKGGNTVRFAYGVDRSRYRRIDQGASGTTTTRYIGNVEIIERPNGTQERKRYIAGVAIETGFYTGGTETSRETLYTLKDHLGSLDVILDDTGAVEQKLAFGPWGQRRDATNWKEVNSGNSLIDLGLTFDSSRTTRGFTGHEMVDSVGIVHMNGRIYDPFLGRFLQSD